MCHRCCVTALSGSEGDCVAAWRDEAASLQKPSVSPCHRNHLGKELIPRFTQSENSLLCLELLLNLLKNLLQKHSSVSCGAELKQGLSLRRGFHPRGSRFGFPPAQSWPLNKFPSVFPALWGEFFWLTVGSWKANNNCYTRALL